MDSYNSDLQSTPVMKSRWTGKDQPKKTSDLRKKLLVCSTPNALPIIDFSFKEGVSAVLDEHDDSFNTSEGFSNSHNQTVIESAMGSVSGQAKTKSDVADGYDADEETVVTDDTGISETKDIELNNFILQNDQEKISNTQCCIEISDDGPLKSLSRLQQSELETDVMKGLHQKFCAVLTSDSEKHESSVFSNAKSKISYSEPINNQLLSLYNCDIVECSVVDSESIDVEISTVSSLGDTSKSGYIEISSTNSLELEKARSLESVSDDLRSQEKDQCPIVEIFVSDSDENQENQIDKTLIYEAEEETYPNQSGFSKNLESIGEQFSVCGKDETKLENLSSEKVDSHCNFQLWTQDCNFGNSYGPSNCGLKTVIMETVTEEESRDLSLNNFTGNLAVASFQRKIKANEVDNEVCEIDNEVSKGFSASGDNVLNWKGDKVEVVTLSSTRHEAYTFANQTKGSSSDINEENSVSSHNSVTLIHFNKSNGTNIARDNAVGDECLLPTCEMKNLLNDNINVNRATELKNDTDPKGGFYEKSACAVVDGTKLICDESTKELLDFSSSQRLSLPICLNYDSTDSLIDQSLANAEERKGDIDLDSSRNSFSNNQKLQLPSEQPSREPSKKDYRKQEINNNKVERKDGLSIKEISVAGNVDYDRNFEYKSPYEGEDGATLFGNIQKEESMHAIQEFFPEIKSQGENSITDKTVPETFNIDEKLNLPIIENLSTMQTQLNLVFSLSENKFERAEEKILAINRGDTDMSNALESFEVKAHLNDEQNLSTITLERSEVNSSKLALPCILTNNSECGERILGKILKSDTGGVCDSASASKGFDSADNTGDDCSKDMGGNIKVLDVSDPDNTMVTCSEVILVNVSVEKNQLDSVDSSRALASVYDLQEVSNEGKNQINGKKDGTVDCSKSVLDSLITETVDEVIEEDVSHVDLSQATKCPTPYVASSLKTGLTVPEDQTLPKSQSQETIEENKINRLSNISTDENNLMLTEEDEYFSKKDEISICFDTRNDSFMDIKDGPALQDTGGNRDGTTSKMDTNSVKPVVPDIEALKQKHQNELKLPPKKKFRLEVPDATTDRPLEVFVSSNASENADNNNPQWQVYKKLTNDELRYECVRKKWLNPQIPNMNTNLSTYNWRARNGLQPLTISKDNVQFHFGFQSGSIQDVFTKARDNAKILFEQKVKGLAVRRDRRYNSLDSNFNFSLVVTNPKWHPQYYSYYRQELDTIQNDYMTQFDLLLEGLEKRMSAIDAAEEEVNTVSNFYKGLNTNGSTSHTHFTPRQLHCWFDREDTLNAYEAFYSGNN